MEGITTSMYIYIILFRLQFLVLLSSTNYDENKFLALHSNKTLFSNLTKVKLKFRNLSSNGGGHSTLVVNSSLKNRTKKENI